MERKTFSVNYNSVLPNGNNEPKSGNGSEEQSSTVIECSLGADDIGGVY